MSTHPYYVPDFLVKVRGLPLEADVKNAVISLTFDSVLDAADMFTLEINNADLRFLDSDLFQIGQEVEIHMGYVGNLQPMLLGEITALKPSFPEGSQPTLTVTGYDKSHRMRHGTPLRLPFIGLNDSLIAAQIAAENFLIPIVDPSLLLPRESYHHNGSDWQLLQELADRNGFWVYVHWDKLYFRFPRPQKDLVVLEWGENLSSFSPRLSSSGLAGIQIIRGYSELLAQEIVTVLPALSLGSDLDDTIGRLSQSSIDYLVRLGRNVVRDQTIENFSDALTIAKTVLLELFQGLYEGSGHCVGIPTLLARDSVEIRGIGKQFSGRYTLSRVTHSIDNNGYRTRFDVTQKYTSTFLQSLHTRVKDAPSPKKQERITGLMIGKVINNVDPKMTGRVQVQFPHLSETDLIWARLAQGPAGSSQGLYFLPDVGDEVVVAFERGDINKPVVLGGLWSNVARPPAVNEGINAQKMIATRSGMAIEFDDTPGVTTLTLRSATGASIEIAQDLNSITLIDPSQNRVRLSQGGVEIDSNTYVKLSVGGSSIELTPAGVQIRGTAIDLN